MATTLKKYVDKTHINDTRFKNTTHMSMFIISFSMPIQDPYLILIASEAESWLQLFLSNVH